MEEFIHLYTLLGTYMRGEYCVLSIKFAIGNGKARQHTVSNFFMLFRTLVWLDVVVFFSENNNHQRAFWASIRASSGST